MLYYTISILIKYINYIHCIWCNILYTINYIISLKIIIQIFSNQSLLIFNQSLLVFNQELFNKAIYIKYLKHILILVIVTKNQKKIKVKSVQKYK